MNIVNMRATAASTIGSLVLIGSASAAYLEGEVISFGVANTKNGAPNPETMSGIAPTVVSGFIGIGDYAAMNGMGPVSFTPFDFGTVGNFVTDPATPFTLWSQAGSGFYFVLESLTENENTTAGDRELAGTGTVHAPGFDPTPAIWDLRTSGTRNPFFYVWDTASVPQGTVPDHGGTLALLGASLLTLPVLRSKMAKKKVSQLVD